MPDDSSVKQPETTKKTGFQLHPENINRNGRPPRDWSWAELIEDEVNANVDLLQKDGGKLTIATKKAIVKRLVQLALSGDKYAINDIMNRMEGMPRQQTDITSGGKPLINFDLHGDRTNQSDGINQSATKAITSTENTSDTAV